MSDAQRLAEVLARFDASPALRRLKLRVRELGANVHDEVEQLKLLQKACREDTALSQALVAAGFPDLTKTALTRVTPEVGVVVQAFNAVVEEVWTRRSVRPNAS